MSHDKSAVRKILDRAKAAGREALTAPEARGVCEAYGITIPKEGVASSADEAAKLFLSLTAFVGGALAFRARHHTTVEFLTGRLSPRWRNSLSTPNSLRPCGNRRG